MIVLFALGVMSLFWMALVAAVIFVQKVIPWGERLTTAFAVALVALGIWVAAAPGSVPDLTQPGSNPAMNMKMNTDKTSTDKMTTDKMTIDKMTP
jgi:cytochrome c biogenesis protein CcdA